VLRTRVAARAMISRHLSADVASRPAAMRPVAKAAIPASPAAATRQAATGCPAANPEVAAMAVAPHPVVVNQILGAAAQLGRRSRHRIRRASLTDRSSTVAETLRGSTARRTYCYRVKLARSWLFRNQVALVIAEIGRCPADVLRFEVAGWRIPAHGRAISTSRFAVVQRMLALV